MVKAKIRLRNYSVYRSSGTTWIGRIPEKWKIKRLASFGKFFKGGGFSKSDIISCGEPAIIYGDLYTKYNFRITKVVAKISANIAQKSVEIIKGDILFTGSGETLDDIGKCVAFYIDQKGYAGGDLIIFRQCAYNPIYLSYCLNSHGIREEKAKEAKGEIIIHTSLSGNRVLLECF